MIVITPFLAERLVGVIRYTLLPYHDNKLEKFHGWLRRGGRKKGNKVVCNREIGYNFINRVIAEMEGRYGSVLYKGNQIA